MYHDALSVARRFRTLLFLGLGLVVLTQVGLFLGLKFSPEFRDAVGLGEATTDPRQTPWPAVMYMVANAMLWLGLVLSVLLTLTAGFATLVMLNGRTVGVPSAARAVIWSLPLVLLFVPWQAMFHHPSTDGRRFPVPGVLWTYEELTKNLPDFLLAEWLGWFRFVAWPVLALALLLVVYLTLGRGIRRATGEDLLEEEQDPATVVA